MSVQLLKEAARRHITVHVRPVENECFLRAFGPQKTLLFSSLGLCSAVQCTRDIDIDEMSQAQVDSESEERKRSRRKLLGSIEL